MLQICGTNKSSDLMYSQDCINTRSVPKGRSGSKEGITFYPGICLVQPASVSVVAQSTKMMQLMSCPLHLSLWMVIPGRASFVEGSVHFSWNPLHGKESTLLKQMAVCFIVPDTWVKTAVVLKVKHQHLWSSSFTNCLYSLKQINIISLSLQQISSEMKIVAGTFLVVGRIKWCHR